MKSSLIFGFLSLGTLDQVELEVSLSKLKPHIVWIILKNRKTEKEKSTRISKKDM